MYGSLTILPPSCFEILWTSISSLKLHVQNQKFSVVQYFPRLAFLNFILNFILSCFFLYLKVYANEAECKQWRHERFAIAPLGWQSSRNTKGMVPRDFNSLKFYALFAERGGGVWEQDFQNKLFQIQFYPILTTSHTHWCQYFILLSVINLSKVAKHSKFFFFSNFRTLIQITSLFLWLL